MDAKRLRVGDIEMAYEEAGSGERPFVLVYGFTGSRDDFSDVLPELGELGHTVILDQRGHGDSTNTRDRSTCHFAQLQEDLLGFLDAMGIERCELLGHSMGGVVGLRFALDHPERVASLVLMDTTPGPIGVLPKGFVGAEDVPFLRPSREVAEGIGGAAHEIVADAAHSPHLENRDVWLAAIRARLRRARA